MTHVSFVIPVYNKASHMDMMLHSLIHQQTTADIEIICVNDGSTDHTTSILETWEQHHPSIKIITQQNEGPSIATNRGIEACTGDWVWCVDADDAIHPQAVSIILEALQREKASMAIVQAQTCPTSRFETAWPAFQKHHTSIKTTPFRWDFQFMGSLTRIFQTRESAQKNLCYDKVFTQDYSPVLGIFSSYEGIHIHNPLYFYRVDQKNAQLSYHRTQQHHDASLTEALFIENTQHPLPWSFQKKCLERSWLRLCRMYKKTRNYKGWLYAFLKHLQCYTLGQRAPHLVAEDIFHTCDLFRKHCSIRLTHPFQSFLRKCKKNL